MDSKNTIDQRFYKENLFRMVGREFDFVSTIDHPFSSPPARIIDGHYKILLKSMEGYRPLICIWDVNYPSSVRYRLELSLDTGFFCTKDSNFNIFSSSHLYPLQKPKMIDFVEIKKRLTFILGNKTDKKKKTTEPRNRAILENLDEVIGLYKKNIKKSENGTVFYENSIVDMYTLFGLEELSKFFGKNRYPYYGSPLMCSWIAFCIKTSSGTPYDFLNLFKNNVFKNQVFRPTQEMSAPFDFKLYDMQQVLTLLEKSQIIPSYEVLFWTLSLAGIRHFGNDYNFFEKLDIFYHEKGISMGERPPQLQITKYNCDSENIVQFKHDDSFNCFPEKGKYVIKKNNNVKMSRIGSLPALYIYDGANLGKTLIKLLENDIAKPFIINN